MLKRAKDYMLDVTDHLVHAETRMSEVIDKMVLENRQSIIVVNDQRLAIGIITGSDLVREITRELKSSVLSTGIAQLIMTKPVVSIPEDTLMLDTVEIMFRTRFHSLLVTKEENNIMFPVGIITHIQIAQWWIDEHGLR